MTKKEPIKCLLVDDIPQNLVALEALLQGEQVQFLKAQSGNEALEILLQHPDIALALLDVQMPEMNGFELAEYIRGSEKTRHIPLIFITAGSHEKSWQFKGYESGAVDFLYKPINPHILSSKVRIFFELHRRKQELAQQLEERTEALRINDMFMAVLSHDLRNPLQLIKNSATLLKRQLPDPKSVEHAERILQKSQHMARMIEELLDITRIRQPGGLRLATDTLDLDAFLQQSIQDMQQLHPHCVFDYQSLGAALGQWDAPRLQQAITNILGNALQHGDLSQPIRIRLDHDTHKPAHFHLAISNAGEIPKEHLCDLFTPFKGDKPRLGLEGGLGLGLYIAHQIIQAHQGEITVCAGNGKTTLHICLPKQMLPSDAVTSFA